MRRPYRAVKKRQFPFVRVVENSVAVEIFREIEHAVAVDILRRVEYAVIVQVLTLVAFPIPVKIFREIERAVAVRVLIGVKFAVMVGVLSGIKIAVRVQVFRAIESAVTVQVLILTDYGHPPIIFRIDRQCNRRIAAGASERAHHCLCRGRAIRELDHLVHEDLFRVCVKIERGRHVGIAGTDGVHFVLVDKLRQPFH